MNSVIRVSEEPGGKTVFFASDIFSSVNLLARVEIWQARHGCQKVMVLVRN